MASDWSQAGTSKQIEDVREEENPSQQLTVSEVDENPSEQLEELGDLFPYSSFAKSFAKSFEDVSEKEENKKLEVSQEDDVTYFSSPKSQIVTAIAFHPEKNFIDIRTS